MIQIFRNSLIFLLVMLQLFAPLVHAHTGSHHFNQGLHIPGLESYIADHDAVIGQQVKIDNNGSDNEGLLILVDAGIKNPHDVITEAEHQDFVFLPAKNLQKLGVPLSCCNIFSYNQVVNLQKPFSPTSPRAPPA